MVYSLHRSASDVERINGRGDFSSVIRQKRQKLPRLGTLSKGWPHLNSCGCYLNPEPWGRGTLADIGRPFKVSPYRRILGRGAVGVGRRLLAFPMSRASTAGATFRPLLGRSATSCFCLWCQDLGGSGPPWATLSQILTSWHFLRCQDLGQSGPRSVPP